MFARLIEYIKRKFDDRLFNGVTKLRWPEEIPIGQQWLATRLVPDASWGLVGDEGFLTNLYLLAFWSGWRRCSLLSLTLPSERRLFVMIMPRGALGAEQLADLLNAIYNGRQITTPATLLVSDALFCCAPEWLDYAHRTMDVLSGCAHFATIKNESARELALGE